jgi:hypothetical protein
MMGQWRDKWQLALQKEGLSELRSWSGVISRVFSDIPIPQITV